VREARQANAAKAADEQLLAADWPGDLLPARARPVTGVQRLYDDDLCGDGYVMNLTRVWAAHDPGLLDRLHDLMGHAARDLSFRDRGVLVSATAGS